MKVRNPYVKQDHDAATPSSSDSLSPAGSQTDSSLTEHSDVNSSSQVSIPHRFYPRWAPLSQEPLKLWKREAKGGSSYCMISQGRYPKRVSVEPFMGQWRIDIRKVRSGDVCMHLCVYFQLIDVLVPSEGGELASDYKGYLTVSAGVPCLA